MRRRASAVIGFGAMLAATASCGGSDSSDPTIVASVGGAGGTTAGPGGTSASAGAAGSATGKGGAAASGGGAQAGFPGTAGKSGGAGAAQAGAAGMGGKANTGGSAGAAGKGGAAGTTAGGSTGTGGSAPPVDACAKASKDGDWCGAALGASDASTLYHCLAGKTVGASPCATTCHGTSGMGSDYCDQPAQADPCAGATSGDGAYCGASLTPAGDLGTLYSCKAQKSVGTQACGAPGCHVSAPGQADYCNGAPSTDPCASATSGDGAYCGAGLSGGDAGTLYTCVGKTTAGTEACSAGCHTAPPGQADYCETGSSGAGGGGPGGGTVMCSAKQWWNATITYGPYMDYNPGNGATYWWDTDLGVPANSPVQLRHDSKLIDQGTHAWGWQPTFVDQVTGKTFQFLHLRPQDQYTTQIGTVYPSGTIVGLSGGDTADTGYPKYSTAAHLCVQTIDTWQSSFPPGMEACK